MFIRDEGSEEPVVLIHGLGASSRVFDPLFAQRPVGARIIAFDLPRTGGSSDWAPSRPDAIADRLADILAERGVASAHVFGHSFGALVALSLAAARPGMIRSLTVASAPALGLPAELRLWLESPFAAVAAGLWGASPAALPMLYGYLGFIWGQPTNLSEAQVSVYRDAQRAPGFGEGVMEALRAIGRFRLPTTALRGGAYPKRVLWGDRDPLVPGAVGTRLAEAIGAELRVLEGVGHCVPDERPETVWEELARSLFPGDQAA